MSLNVVNNPKPEPKEDGPLLTLTPVAVKMVLQTKAAENLEDHFLRIGVVGGGCSGFNYMLDFDTETHDDDLAWEVDGLTIRVDPMSATYLKGVVIDYVTQGLSGGFKFNNPNAARTCGCGTSFSPT